MVNTSNRRNDKIETLINNDLVPVVVDFFTKRIKKGILENGGVDLIGYENLKRVRDAFMGDESFQEMGLRVRVLSRRKEKRKNYRNNGRIYRYSIDLEKYFSIYLTKEFEPPTRDLIELGYD